MSSADLVLFLQLVSLAGCSLTAGKLLVSGLHRQYRIFWFFLLFLIPDSIFPLVLGTSSQLYLKLWICTEPALWIFYIFVVLELYGLILEKHKGLYTLGRWAMYFSVVVSVALSVLSLLPRITPAMPQASKRMGYILAAERGVDLSLVIFIVLILGFLTLYPVPLSRNVIVHTLVYSVFFVSNTLGVLLRVMLGVRVKNEVNLFLMGVSSVCMLAWFFLLNAKGEEVHLNLPWLGAPQEKRLLQQLDALNATLLRVSRN